MSYKKGKDIKVPFDCLWHCMTRKFEVMSTNVKPDSVKHIRTWFNGLELEEFEKW